MTVATAAPTNKRLVTTHRLDAGIQPSANAAGGAAQNSVDAMSLITTTQSKTLLFATPAVQEGNVLTKDPTDTVTMQTPSANAIGNQTGAAEPGVSATGVNVRQYIIGAFLPTIFAVTFSIPWHLLASALKDMEPFYQLQRSEGVSASQSLLLDYNSSINVVATIIAIGRRHFFVWWSGLISLVVLLIAPLASEAIFIGFVGQGVCTATSGRTACTPRLSVYPMAARTLQGLLVTIAILTAVLTVALTRRKSGVYSNPRSIAGAAALFQNRHLIEEFRCLSPYATDKRTLMAVLQHRRYRIGSYKEKDGDSFYGLMVYQQDAANDGRIQNPIEKRHESIVAAAVDENLSPWSKLKISSASFLVHPVSIIIYGFLIAGLETLVIYYNVTFADTSFERFMDNQSFGVAFLFTAVGVGIEKYWTFLDDEIRAMEPYRQLLRGNALAANSILLAPRSNPYTSFFYAFRKGQFFNAYISFVAILCQPLIIALSNIPFSPAEAFMAHQACTYITIAILNLMLIGIVWMFLRRSTLRAMRPDTLAGLLIFLCGSHVLDKFAGLSTFERKERDDIVNGWGKEYSMGPFIGVDGVEREGIDEATYVGNEKRRRSFESEK